MLRARASDVLLSGMRRVVHVASVAVYASRRPSPSVRAHVRAHGSSQIEHPLSLPNGFLSSLRRRRRASRSRCPPTACASATRSAPAVLARHTATQSVGVEIARGGLARGVRCRQCRLRWSGLARPQLGPRRVVPCRGAGTRAQSTPSRQREDEGRPAVLNVPLRGGNAVRTQSAGGGLARGGCGCVPR